MKEILRENEMLNNQEIKSILTNAKLRQDMTENAKNNLRLLSESFNFSVNELKTIIKTYPRIITYKNNVLEENVNTLLNLEIDKKDVINHPSILVIPSKSFSARFAVARYFYIPLQTFLNDKFYLFSEEKLFTRISFLMHKNYSLVEIAELLPSFESNFKISDEHLKKYAFLGKKREEVLKFSKIKEKNVVEDELCD